MTMTTTLAVKEHIIRISRFGSIIHVSYTQCVSPVLLGLSVASCFATKFGLTCVHTFRFTPCQRHPTVLCLLGDRYL